MVISIMGRRIRDATLIAICLTTFATVVQTAQLQDGSKFEVIDFAKIPEATELGWVEVERRQRDGGWGWQCDKLRHLAAVDRLRLGGAGAVHKRTWLEVSGTRVIARLSRYADEPTAKRGKGRTFQWRNWLRRTLERINEAADASDMPPVRRTRALYNWVMCHLSVAEAQVVRRLIDEL